MRAQGCSQMHEQGLHTYTHKYIWYSYDRPQSDYNKSFNSTSVYQLPTVCKALSKEGDQKSESAFKKLIFTVRIANCIR